MDKLKRGIWVFIQWFFGIAFLISALGHIIGTSEGGTIGSFMLSVILGCICIPPIRKRLKERTGDFDLSDINPFAKGNREFKKEMADALEDGVLTDEEAAHLEHKADELGVSQEYSDKLRHKDFEKRIKPVLARIEETRRFSPEDENELTQIAGDLQIKSDLGPEFQMFRDLWEYENDGAFPLKAIDVPILLNGKNEECYFEAPAVWKQFKTVREHAGYAGASVGFRVAKGVRFSVGRAVPVGRQYEEIQPISDGEIYVTNKKVIFNGAKRSTNVTMGRIVQVELYNDGIEIKKTSGKPDYFKMNSIHAEYIAAIIHNMMNN